MNKITFGDNIKIEILGGSHDKEMTLFIRHFPRGVKIDKDELIKFLSRRKPRAELCGTPRCEEDIPEILSGLEDNITTGGEIKVVVKNNDVRPSDYDFDDTPRPSHADYVSHVKFGEAISGGGMSSGRITVMYVIAGFFAKTYLETLGIKVYSFVKSIGDVERNGYDVNAPEDFSYIADITENMAGELSRANIAGDSVGGIIEGGILGLKAGIGDIGFLSLEGKISNAIFGIPAVKGVEFGSGFDITKKLGNDANDGFIYQNCVVKTISNNNGGINGGISNGMPIVVNVAVKPTPSISKEQNTISLKTGENVTLEIKGRHDTCIAVRFGVILESVLALVVLDEIDFTDDILSLRDKIDNIDDEIISLLEKRNAISQQIGDIKKQNNISVLDKNREEEIVGRLSRGGIEKADIEKLYNVIFDISKRKQK